VKAAIVGVSGSANGSRQDSQESTISGSSSIREFELFQQFCSNTPGPVDWVSASLNSMQHFLLFKALYCLDEMHIFVFNLSMKAN